MSAPTPFLGMRGSGDFTVTGQRPENWREMILYLYPNGKAPLTALMSMQKSEKTDDAKFHWFELEMPDQTAVVTGVYGGTNLSDAYAAAAVGDLFYVKMSAVDAAKFNVSHQVMMVINALPSTRITAKVTVAPVINGDSSYVTCKLLQVDGTSTIGAAIHSAVSAGSSMIVIGSVNPEGGNAPASLIYDPNEVNSYTQIFRTSLDQTRTAMRTRLRTGDQVKEAKRQALEMHSVEMEKAFWFSYLSLAADSGNGKPVRTTRGLRNYISSNVFDFTTDSVYGSSTWIQGGENFLEASLEQIFRYGNTEKVAFCGSGALLGIQQLVKVGARITVQPGVASYGIKVVTWETPFGTLQLKLHPLFTLIPALRYTMGVIDPPHLVYRYVDDTKYLPNRQAPDLDGEKSEFLTEAGLEIHFEKAHGWFDGIGRNGVL